MNKVVTMVKKLAARLAAEDVQAVISVKWPKQIRLEVYIKTSGYASPPDVICHVYEDTLDEQSEDQAIESLATQIQAKKRTK